MEILKNIVLEKEGFKPILMDFFYKKSIQNMPIVIFCHGYKGFKDWGAWDLVGKKFANNNFFFIKFNFSHNGGTVENPIDFGSIDARVLKLSAEIDLIQSEEIPEFKRLKLISSLRILQSRTQLALSSLNTKAESFKLLDSKLIKK